MSKRLQVLVEEREFREMQDAARRRGMTLAEWVRQALRGASSRESSGNMDAKLARVRAAARYTFPAPDIEQMLAEIASGYHVETSE